jgi:hypothetical protein
VKLRLGKTNQGNIVAELNNPTPKNLGNIKLLLQFQSPTGRMQQVQQQLKGSVAAGKKQTFSLNLPALTDQELQSLQGKVIGAQVIN